VIVGDGSVQGRQNVRAVGVGGFKSWHGAIGDVWGRSQGGHSRFVLDSRGGRSCGRRRKIDSCRGGDDWSLRNAVSGSHRGTLIAHDAEELISTRRGAGLLECAVLACKPCKLRGAVAGVVDVGSICGWRMCDRGRVLHLVPVGPSVQDEAGGCSMIVPVALEAPAIDAMTGKHEGCGSVGRRRWFRIGTWKIGGLA
jgi:hypothetical protein